jgi:ABC-2 type transport system ATP-binding protein
VFPVGSNTVTIEVHGHDLSPSIRPVPVLMLAASRLTRRFGDRVAVDDVSFTLERGEIFALLGPNGAGKTTTLRMLAGLIAPTRGEITIANEHLSSANAARLRGRIGFLTEAPGLWDRLTVRQNLTVYAHLHGVADAARAVAATLDAFGVLDRAQDQAAQLSKGLKQRVALARTLLHKPDIVLLDEPTSGLDPESARDVRELILNQRDQGRAVLLSTHNLAEVERIADRVAVLRTRLVAVDTPAALRARLFGSRLRIVTGQPAEVFVGAAAGPGILAVSAEDHSLSISLDDSRSRAPAIVRRLVAAGADIESVLAEEASLEDVYLRLLEDEEPR